MTARVLRQFPLEQGVSKAGNEWKKSTLLVEKDPQSQFPKQIALINMKNAEEFSQLPVGALYEFEFVIESREYNGRFYTDVKCLSFKPAQTQLHPQLQPQNQAPQPTYTQPQPRTYAPPQGNQYTPQPQDDGIPF